MSKIEWTGKTWNPVLGCKPVSPGCANCYAEQMTGRCAAMGNADYAGLTRRGENGKTYLFTGDFRELPVRLDEPLRRNTPTTYFVNSMSDLFGEGVSNEFIAAVFGVMAACPQHIFQVLTKRADRMVKWFDWLVKRAVYRATSPEGLMRRYTKERLSFQHASHSLLHWRNGQEERWPLPNVHIGVSVENRKHGLPRIEELRKVPAAVRFLSVEPLLEDLGTLDLTGIHWVIVGGESGHSARPMNPDWVRKVRDQCIAVRVPFFFKQWGQWTPNTPNRYSLENVALWNRKDSDGWIFLKDLEKNRREHWNEHQSGDIRMYRVGKKNAGRILDGREWSEVPK